MKEEKCEIHTYPSSPQHDDESLIWITTYPRHSTVNKLLSHIARIKLSEPSRRWVHCATLESDFFDATRERKKCDTEGELNLCEVLVASFSIFKIIFISPIKQVRYLQAAPQTMSRHEKQCSINSTVTIASFSHSIAASFLLRRLLDDSHLASLSLSSKYFFLLIVSSRGGYEKNKIKYEKVKHEIWVNLI